MPGLVDAHAHFFHPPVFGRLMLANGVLVVRDMGQVTRDMLKVRSEQDAGTLGEGRLYGGSGGTGTSLCTRASGWQIMRRRVIMSSLRSSLSVCLLLAAGLAGCRPAPTPTPMPTAQPSPLATPVGPPAPPRPTPTVDPSSVLPYLPASAHPLSFLAGDLDGDLKPEVVVLTGFDGAAESAVYEWLELYVIEPDHVQLPVTFRSGRLRGQRAEPLQWNDINADGYPEVLSYQGMSAGGRTLYVLAWRGGAFDWLQPQGGHFQGWDSFGEASAHLEDVTGDLRPEILADYGPEGVSTDAYRWDGTQYVYLTTLEGK